MGVYYSTCAVLLFINRLLFKELFEIFDLKCNLVGQVP